MQRTPGWLCSPSRKVRQLRARVMSWLLRARLGMLTSKPGLSHRACGAFSKLAAERPHARLR